MQGEFALKINGRPHRVAGASVYSNLLDFLRAQGCSGVRSGGGYGEDLSCTVLLLDSDASGLAALRGIPAGHMLLPFLAGREIITIDALASGGQLHPVQETLLRHMPDLSGYMMPGLILSFLEIYYSDFLCAQSEKELLGQFAGVTARQLHPQRLARALRDVLKLSAERPADDPWLIGLRQYMDAQYQEFRYIDAQSRRFYRPITVSALLRLLTEYPDAELMGSGQEYLREAPTQKPLSRCLVTTHCIFELRAVQKMPRGWVVGSSLSLTSLIERLGETYPLLSQLETSLGTRSIRNILTTGELLSQTLASPAFTVILTALQASVRLTSLEEERELPVENFLTDNGDTARRPKEILHSILLPPQEKPVRQGRILQSFYNISSRRYTSPSLLCAAFILLLDKDDRILSARLVYGIPGGKPQRFKTLEDALLKKTWNNDTLESLEHAFSAPEQEALLADRAYSLLRKFYHEHSTNQTSENSASPYL